MVWEGDDDGAPNLLVLWLLLEHMAYLLDRRTVSILRSVVPSAQSHANTKGHSVMTTSYPLCFRHHTGSYWLRYNNEAAVANRSAEYFDGYGNYAKEYQASSNMPGLLEISSETFEREVAAAQARAHVKLIESDRYFKWAFATNAQVVWVKRVDGQLTLFDQHGEEVSYPTFNTDQDYNTNRWTPITREIFECEVAAAQARTHVKPIESATVIVPALPTEAEIRAELLWLDKKPLERSDRRRQFARWLLARLNAVIDAKDSLLANLQNGHDTLMTCVLDRDERLLKLEQELDGSKRYTNAFNKALKEKDDLLERLDERLKCNLAVKDQLFDVQYARAERAERALRRGGWTDGGAEWKPPVGPSVAPLLEKIEVLEAEVNRLAAALLANITCTTLGDASIREDHR
jgi:hypothetical protein